MELLDNGRLAAVGDGTSVAIWNVGRSEMERVARAEQSWSNAFGVSSNGEQLASLDDYGKIHVQSLADLAKGWSITTPLVDTNLGESIGGISFDLEGRHLSIASTTGGVSRWDLLTGARRAEHLAPVPVVLDRAPVPANRRSVTLDPMVPYPNGERYVRISRQEGGGMAAQVFAAPTGKLENTLALEGRAAACVAVSPDSRIVAIGDETGVVTLFDGQTYAQLPWGKLREHVAKAQCVSFSPDGDHLVTASADGVVKCWELPMSAQREDTTEKLVSRLTIACRGAPQSVAITSRNAHVAVSTVDTEVYDAASGNRLFAVPGTTCVFSADGTLLLTGGISARRTGARVWNATTGGELARLDGGHSQAVTSVAISPDGSIAVTGDQEGHVRAWTTKTGEELLAFPEANTETGP
jgi:WD40 repeat protein